MVVVFPSKVQFTDLVVLSKPRIVLMVMLTAAAGFWMASPTGQHTLLLFNTLLGTALVAAGTNALNQVAERDLDALMRRTRMRPIPAGRLSPTVAALFAWLAGVAGIGYLAVTVNLLTAALAAITLLSYVFVYTPLKRHSSASTLIGAIPGALPIVGGWTAATGSLAFAAWALFWIMFLWQLPHFLALGWLYREDYARARFKLLSSGDSDGRLTFVYANLYAAALVPVSLAPTLLGLAGGVYFWGALALGLAFVALCLPAARHIDNARARRAFLASLAYHPLWMGLLVFDTLPL